MCRTVWCGSSCVPGRGEADDSRLPTPDSRAARSSRPRRLGYFLNSIFDSGPRREQLPHATTRGCPTATSSVAQALLAAGPHLTCKRPRFQDPSPWKVNTHEDTPYHPNLVMRVLKACAAVVSFSFHSLIVHILAVLCPPGKT